ncbi:MAG: hypothetical protein AB1611_11030 [bacterium]
MDQHSKQDLFNFLQKFCSDNINNRLNEWIIEAFLNRVYQKLEAICPADNPINNTIREPHDALRKKEPGVRSQESVAGKTSTSYQLSTDK